ncbi:IclR family transcriptional regulator [Actinoplanes awajinensis]|uniref:IclR family transcriptional regulator n=1 Tax=Actinoplanes awajinensis subsp. mycoplanecinus TaxID=135947 RepID=A0A117MPF1_9ACTN|nr:IclR family transcriptional regulator [Actinoplanes awajinensis]KUL28481.1 IclR family transcriptional regulator [Actinoplanes awajinensis subsp. mycoplanecinus]
MAKSVTARALDLLGAFDAEHRALTLSELARRSGTPLATTHRLVGELREWGALAREPTGEYVIGRRIWQLGLLAPVQTGLRTAASPFLHDLYGATLATVHLAVRDGMEVLYIDRLAGHVSVPVISKIGSRLPLHATGVGKVLLAYAPEEVRTAALGRLSRVTAYTITQPARVLEQLRRVRAEGYATTGEEMTLGACSVAVPVRNGDEVVAALGIVVPDLRRQLPRLVSALQVAAQGIGRTLASVQWKQGLARG